MADGIAESVGLSPRAVPGRRATLRVVGADDGSRAVSLLAPMIPRPVLSSSADLFGIGPGGWVGAALLYGALIAGGLWLGWQVTPPAPWPESEAAFRVIFETPPPAPQAEAIPAPPEAPPLPEVLAPPEPAPPEAVVQPEPPPPVVAAEPEPAEVLPQPPPPQPEPRRVVAKRATARPSAALPASEPPIAAPPQVAALPIIPPQPITGRAGNPKPDYPAEARRRGLQGKVVLLVEVSAAGLPASVAVAASSGHAALDQAALAAVQQWRFSPATRGGTPVAGTAQVPIQFRLEE